MREIRFRGKSIKDGKWLYGFFAIIDDKPAIITDSIEWIDGSELRGTCWDYVDGNTVGQFTGLQDSTGKDVYEGDIVRTSIAKDSVGVVEWNNDKASFVVHMKGREQWYPLSNSYTIIGNIHDQKLEDFQ